MVLCFADITVLAITNHGWEAIVGLPLVIVLILREDWRGVFGVCIAIGVSILTVTALTGIQPNPANTSIYAITEVGPSIFLEFSWWYTFYPFNDAHPLFINIHGAHFLVSLLAVIPTAVFSYMSKSKGWGLISAWFACELVIPIVLSAGVGNKYYLWGLIPPVTLSAVVILSTAIENVANSTVLDKNTLMAACVLTSTVFAGGAVVGEYTDTTRYTDSTPSDITISEAKQTGEELQAMGVQDYREVTFVGDWAREDFRSFYFGGAVMVYAEFNVRGTWHMPLYRVGGLFNIRRRSEKWTDLNVR